VDLTGHKKERQWAAGCGVMMGDGGSGAPPEGGGGGAALSRGGGTPARGFPTGGVDGPLVEYRTKGVNYP